MSRFAKRKGYMSKHEDTAVILSGKIKTVSFPAHNSDDTVIKIRPEPDLYALKLIMLYYIDISGL